MSKEVINSKTNYVNIIRLDNILENVLERLNALESKLEEHEGTIIINNHVGVTAQEATDNISMNYDEALRGDNWGTTSNTKYGHKGYIN